jgi:raffinose/stachyose/melibiose transport system permease protein
MSIISAVAWVIKYSDALGWIIFGTALGGFVTPRFNTSSLAIWGGAVFGFITTSATIMLAGIKESVLIIAAAAVLAAALGGYWFGVLRVWQPRDHATSNRLWERYNFNRVFGQLASHAILLIWVLIVLAPFWVMIVNSLKPQRQIFRTPFDFPDAEQRTYDGYESAWLDGNFDVYFKNSINVSINSILLILIIGTMASYALSNWRSRGSSLVYLYFIAGLMIPIRLGTINIVTIVQELGLNGRLEGLIPIYVAMGVPMAIFVLTSFMRGIPQDLLDAARMDGASEFQVLSRIVVPLVRPALATVVILNLIPIYNDLWFPLILTRSESVRTVTYGVSLLFGQYQSDWNAILSTLSLASVPVLIIYLLMSKQFIQGLTAGAVKG